MKVYVNQLKTVVSALQIMLANEICAHDFYLMGRDTSHSYHRCKRCGMLRLLNKEANTFSDFMEDLNQDAKKYENPTTPRF